MKHVLRKTAIVAMAVSTAIATVVPVGSVAAHSSGASAICASSGRVCVFKDAYLNYANDPGVWAYTTTSTSYDLASSGISFNYGTGSNWKGWTSSIQNHRTTRERTFSNTDYGGTERCQEAYGGHEDSLPSDRLHSMAAGVGTTCPAGT